MKATLKLRLNQFHIFSFWCFQTSAKPLWTFWDSRGPCIWGSFSPLKTLGALAIGTTPTALAGKIGCSSDAPWSRSDTRKPSCPTSALSPRMGDFFPPDSSDDSETVGTKALNPPELANSCWACMSNCRGVKSQDFTLALEALKFKFVGGQHLDHVTCRINYMYVRFHATFMLAWLQGHYSWHLVPKSPNPIDMFVGIPSNFYSSKLWPPVHKSRMVTHIERPLPLLISTAQPTKQR